MTMCLMCLILDEEMDVFKKSQYQPPPPGGGVLGSRPLPRLPHDVGFLTLGPKPDPPGSPLLDPSLSKILHSRLRWHRVNCSSFITHPNVTLHFIIAPLNHLCGVSAPPPPLRSSMTRPFRSNSRAPDTRSPALPVVDLGSSRGQIEARLWWAGRARHARRVPGLTDHYSPPPCTPLCPPSCTSCGHPSHLFIRALQLTGVRGRKLIFPVAALFAHGAHLSGDIDVRVGRAPTSPGGRPYLGGGVLRHAAYQGDLNISIGGQLKYL